MTWTGLRVRGESRLWSFAARVVLLVPLLGATPLTPVSAVAQVCGDLNGNGVLEGVDCNHINRVAVGLDDPAPFCNGMGAVSCGDVDLSGDITLTDGYICQRVVMGLPNAFVPCVGPHNPPGAYGVNTSLMFFQYNWVNPNANDGEDVAQAKLLGDGAFKWYRFTLLWDDIETEPDACTNGTPACRWNLVQPAIDDAAERGLGVLLTIAHVPAWANGIDPMNPPPSSCRRNDYWSYPPLDPEPMRKFARAAALKFKLRAAAWEIGNEFNSCRQWKGAPWEWRLRYLVPAFDGIRSAGNPIAIIGAAGLVNAPDVPGASQAELDKWLTYAFGGARYLVRPLDFYSIHTYMAPDDAIARINTAANYTACLHPSEGSWCLFGGGDAAEDGGGGFWLTEFGYGTALGSDPGCHVCAWGTPCNKGNALVRILDHFNPIAQQPFYDGDRKAFIWNAYRNVGQDGCACDTPLIDSSRNRTPAYCSVRNYVLLPNHPIPGCSPALDPCGSCPCNQ